MNHTPGPWKVHPKLPDAVINKHGVIVALMAVNRYGNLEANARLIAAAPTAPHFCDDLDCPGLQNKVKLELAESMARSVEERGGVITELLEALKVAVSSRDGMLLRQLPWSERSQILEAIAKATKGDSPNV